MGVTFWACLAGLPHYPKCLARLIHNTRYYGGCFGLGFNSFASGWPRSASGVDLWACLDGVPHHPKCLARSQLMIPGVVKNF